MRSGNSLVISEQRDETMVAEFSAKMKMPSLKCGERSLDVWLRLEDKTLMCFSIPGITTTLNTLSSSSKCHHHHHHHHHHPHRPNFDEALDTNYDIGTNSFPVIHADFKGPFPLPDIKDLLFRSAVVGHTLFFVGAYRDDLQGWFDIQTESITTYPYAPPSPSKHYYYSTPPPCNRISDQLYNLTKEYLGVPAGNNFHTLTSYSSENCPWSLDNSDNCFLDPYTHTTTPTDDDPPTLTGSYSSGNSPWALNTSDNCFLDPTYTHTRTLTSPVDETMPASPTTTPESPKEPSKGICHKIWTIDLHNPDLGWSEGKSLISPRIYPILVPYQDKLYAFSGNHPSLPFAEVYDPISATWTELPPPPFRSLPDRQMYVVPLKGWNKLWVFGVLRPVDYTYDVLTRKWQKFTGSRDISGIDFKEGSLGARFAFRHLRHDLFCLIGCTYLLDPVPIRTIVHVTLLQVSIKPLSKSSKPLEHPKVPSKIDRARSKKICEAHPLTAAVVACFAYSFKGEIGIRDSYITSQNV